MTILARGIKFFYGSRVICMRRKKRTKFNKSKVSNTIVSVPFAFFGAFVGSLVVQITTGIAQALLVAGTRGKW